MSHIVDAVLSENRDTIKQALHGLFHAVEGLRTVAAAVASASELVPPGNELEILAVKLNLGCEHFAEAAACIPQEVWAEALYGEATAGADEMRGLFLALIARSGSPMSLEQEVVDEFGEEPGGTRIIDSFQTARETRSSNAAAVGRRGSDVPTSGLLADESKGEKT